MRIFTVENLICRIITGAATRLHSAGVMGQMLEEDPQPFQVLHGVDRTWYILSSICMNCVARTILGSITREKYMQGST